MNTIIPAIVFAVFALILLAVFGFVIAGRQTAAVDRRDEDERADIDPYLIHSAARAKYPDSALIRDMHEPVGM